MKTSVRAAVVLLTILGCVGCDQYTKSIARDYLPRETPISLLNDVVRLQRDENPGAFMSLGDSLSTNARRVLFAFGGAVLVIGTAFLALRSRRRSSAHILGAALISGGGFSNLIDRVTQGGNVTDFLNIGVGPLRTGIFNCADVALMLGLAILIFSDSIATRLRSLLR
jgi:signal peptidase II